MVSDIILAVIILIFIALGVKRGIAKTILNIAGIAVTYIGALYLSDFFAKGIYNLFLKQSVIDNINNYISVNGVQYAIDNCLSALPDWLNSFITTILSFCGGNLENFLSYSDVEFAKASTATAYTIEPMVQIAVVSVFGIILLVILFIIIFIFVKKLIRLVSKAFKAPVISQLNSFFGGLLGIVYGLIVAFIIANVAGIVLSCSAPEIIADDKIIGSFFKFLSLTI